MCLSLAVKGSRQDGVVSLSSAVDCGQPSRVSFPAGVVTTPGQSSADAIIGWAFYLLLVFVGLASIVGTTVFAYRRLRAHGVRDSALVASTVAVAGLAFIGLWVVADMYWLGRGIARLFRRATPGAA